MSAGVYALYFNEICLYVGQSVNTDKRRNQHFAGLRSGTHSRDDLMKWMNDNSVILEQIDFKVLEFAVEPIQESLNLLEVKYYNLLSPLFAGQSPSMRNDYTALMNNPEIAKAMGRKISDRIAQSSTGEYRFENDRRIWGRKCLNCPKTYDSYSPTGFYCSKTCKEDYLKFEKNCETCKTPFIAKYEKTKFCHECKYTVHEYALKCKVCKEDFISGRPDSKYCDLKCKQESQKVSQICGSCDEFYLDVKPGRCDRCREAKLWGCICADCKNKFQGSGPMTKFCSASCGNERRCLECSAIFKTRTKTTTCSKDCSKTLKSPSSSRVSKEAIKAMEMQSMSPKEIMKQLGLSKSTYYRIKSS